MMRSWLLAGVVVLAGVPAWAQLRFVNWESPHVHPLDRTPDGSRLLAVNTPDARLELFTIEQGGHLIHAASIPVGIDPVSVRARTNTEAWVVNHISDSVSIVDLVTGSVVATLRTEDEPADVVFAGEPQRAFVSCSQANKVLVFDPADRAKPPIQIKLDGEDPRALAVSPTGNEVYVAVFESGNGSTILAGGLRQRQAPNLPLGVVNDAAGPYGGQNPPPNSGTVFDPPQASGNPLPPPVGLIVKKDAEGRWKDDNGSDWTDFVSGPQAAKSARPVGWDLPDRDLAVIDAATLVVSYATGLMNICMGLAVNPASGEIAVVGTDATNEIRFEPKVQGRFVRVHLARVEPGGPSRLSVVDLNPHLDYLTPTLPQFERDNSIGDPRAIVWNAAGDRGYVAGMGSNNLIALDAAGNRAGLGTPVAVGEGPTGIVLDEPNNRAYVLNKFEASISIVATTAPETELRRVPLYDPSPSAIKTGRRHLYDTHKNSGLGQIACASCHVDARMDRLAWDLGNPAGSVKSTAGQNLGMGISGLTSSFQDWHPMKGPMTTQTLQDIIGHEPFHWRGDRAGIEEFNPAFIGLQGDDADLSPQEMQEFEDFLATIHFPPNPFRNEDNTLPTLLPLPGHFTTGRFGPQGQPLPPGNAANGLTLFRSTGRRLDNNRFACVTCHTLPTGTAPDSAFSNGSFLPIPPGLNGERHHGLVSTDGSTNVTMKVPQLRNLYEKVGFDTTQTSNAAGFGFLHDGSDDSLARFVSEAVFTVQTNQEVADLVAFQLAFSGSDLPQGSATNVLQPPGTAGKDTHAAVGRQLTVDAANLFAPATIDFLNRARAMADQARVGLVAKGVQRGVLRGYAYVGAGTFASDRCAESVAADDLRLAADVGSELTFTIVPNGTQRRIGIDRDEDGVLDRDELDSGSDPADPTSLPASFPVAPASLSGAAVGSDAIQLNWTQASVEEEGFLVERSPAGAGAFTLVATLGPNVTGYLDAGLACGTPFDYRVRAFACASESENAVTTAATGGGTIPAAPVGLVGTAAGSTAITLTWIDQSSGEEGFRLERAPAATGSFVLVATLSSNATSYTDTGLTPGASYDYRLRSFNCAGESANATASLTLPPPLSGTIAFDGFESGTASGGTGWSGPWTSSGDNSIRTESGTAEGSRHARQRRSTGYGKRVVNLSGVTNARLKFWSRVNSFEGSDRAEVLVSPNGTSFSVVRTFTSAQSDGTYHFYDIDISGFAMTSGFTIAFDAGMNSTGDQWYLDAIAVEGIR